MSPATVASGRLRVFFLPCSEWVIGNREELAKDIIAEIQPENGEVMFVEIVSFLCRMQHLWKNFLCFAIIYA